MRPPLQSKLSPMQSESLTARTREQASLRPPMQSMQSMRSLIAGTPGTRKHTKLVSTCAAALLKYIVGVPVSSLLNLVLNYCD
eukprot:SAG31_NODE_9622_length_1249_cov_5.490435_2_plen_82_part_01